LEPAVGAQVFVQAHGGAARICGAHGQPPGFCLSAELPARAVQGGEGDLVGQVAEDAAGQGAGRGRPERWVKLCAHSLIAPWLIPAMKLRWKIRYMITIGATVMIVAAASSGMLVVYCPTNRPSPAGAVRIAGSCISTITSRNWFQVHMNTSTASVV